MFITVKEYQQVRELLMTVNEQLIVNSMTVNEQLIVNSLHAG